jgi:FKBP-type peptidyl-prolyl cis-trans isomerase FkpA
MRLPLLAVVLSAVALVACDTPIPEPEPAPRAAKSTEPEKPEPADLIKEDLKVGEGEREVKTGDEILVHYTGKLLKNGFKFDSSVGREPFPFKVGEGVIQGWSDGVVGMKKGGKRKLTIPSKLGYGDEGSPPKIPGKATLVFEVELLKWKDEAAPAASASAAASADAKPKKEKKEEKKEPKKEPKKDDHAGHGH